MALKQPQDYSYGATMKYRFFPKGTGAAHFKDMSGAELILALGDDGAQVDGIFGGAGVVIPDMLKPLARSTITAVSSNSADANASVDYGEGIGVESSRDDTMENVLIILQDMTGNRKSVWRFPTTAAKKAEVLDSEKAYRNLFRQIAQRFGMVKAGTGGYSHESPSVISIDGKSYKVSSFDEASSDATKKWTPEV